MTNEEIEKQSEAVAQLLRRSIDPLALKILGDSWCDEFVQALLGYARHVALQAFEEAEQEFAFDCPCEVVYLSGKSHRAECPVQRIRKLHQSLDVQSVGV